MLPVIRILMNNYDYSNAMSLHDPWITGLGSGAHGSQALSVRLCYR